MKSPKNLVQGFKSAHLNVIVSNQKKVKTNKKQRSNRKFKSVYNNEFQKMKNKNPLNEECNDEQHINKNSSRNHFKYRQGQFSMREIKIEKPILQL